MHTLFRGPSRSIMSQPHSGHSIDSVLVSESSFSAVIFADACFLGPDLRALLFRRRADASFDFPGLDATRCKSGSLMRSFSKTIG